MIVREAQEADFSAITAIYNDVLVNSTAIYADEPATVADRIGVWQARQQQNYPTLVALDAEHVIGFASFGDFRAWPGYRYTVEHSVHVLAPWRGRGAGSALVRALVPRAEALGKHVMIGGIDAGNTASLRFHERLGFERVAHFREVGFKFGRFLDLVFVQLAIGGEKVQAGLSHNKRFRCIYNSTAGAATSDTVFHYRQDGGIVWGTYSGGGVAHGTLLAKVHSDDELDMRYLQVGADGSFRSGTCRSRPKRREDGRLIVEEEWQWDAGGSGRSTILEV
jgi:L-amino acid N-acyltransferase YncA